MTNTLPHHETERQRSVNNIWFCILGTQGFLRIGAPITELLTTSIAKNATDRRQNMYSKIINVADCKTSKKRSLAVKYLISTMFNYPTAKTTTLYKSTDGPTDNPPNPNRLGDLHWTVPELTVRVCWQPGPPIWQRFGSDRDPDPKWRSRTVANTNYAKVTPTMGILLISAHILDPFWKLCSLRKCDNGMDINPEDETSDTTQYQEAFLMYVENEYCAKHWGVPVNKHQSLRSSNHISSAMASQSCQSSFDPDDLSSDDEEYLTPNNVAETTSGRSDCAAPLLTAAKLSLNSPPEATKNWGQINPNLNDYHSDPMEFCSTFWIPDITDWWRQQEETHSKYADLSNVAHNIFSIIPHGDGVEASFSLRRDVIGWRQSKTTGETLREKVVVRQFTRANNGILAGTDPELDNTNTENDSEMKK